MIATTEDRYVVWSPSLAGWCDKMGAYPDGAWAAVSVENGRVVHVRAVAAPKRDGNARNNVWKAQEDMWAEPRLPQTRIGLLKLPSMEFFPKC